MRETDHPAFEIVRDAIRGGPIPGAAVAVGGPDGVRYACFGCISSPVGAAIPAGVEPSPSGAVSSSVAEPVTLETVYDLASLTKVLLTVTLLVRAVGNGILDPNARLETIVPEVAGFDLADATICQLASHRAGLAAFSKLRFLGLPREQALRRALEEPRLNPRGTVLYSDQGFIALGAILERLYRARLDALADDLFGRLGLGLTFHPDPSRCAPTEFVPERGGLIRGLVHDENAASLGGVAGHAGLFGSVRDVAGFVTALLEARIVPSADLEFMFAERARAANDRRAFGWVMRHDGWTGGDAAPDSALGHTGFTGTGVWFDPVCARFFVLLTNRVNPSRHVETGIRELRLAVGNAVWTS